MPHTLVIAGLFFLASAPTVFANFFFFWAFCPQDYPIPRQPLDELPWILPWPPKPTFFVTS